MVKVNNLDEAQTKPLTRCSISPMNWFEHSGKLYLAFEWKDIGYGKFSLMTICFDTDWCAVKTPFDESPDVIVKVVYDRDVSIRYTPAKIL